ncbi:MAG TPA: hypothetical protein VHU92_19410 [Streptosporangiaceae bacterium]|jgi:hypothetical protein|nr:hypothetical protein [Streptosporangiaceae bacterium]
MASASAAGDAPLAWAVRGAEVAAELNRTAAAMRGHLGLIEQQCASLRSQLRRQPARHRLGPPPTDLADQLMMAAAAARRRLDIVEHQCDDVVIKARRVQQPALAAATADHIGEIAAGLDQQAASARAGLAEVDRECESLRAQLDQLLAGDRPGQSASASAGQETLLTDAAGTGA